MILIDLDRKRKQPLFEQVVDQLKQLIDSGDLQVGENLPSTRKLAESLGVHRTTVYRAYEELWAAGYLEATAGGYSRVRQRGRLLVPVSEEKVAVINWDDRLSDAAGRVNNVNSQLSNFTAGLIDFRALSPDSDLLPVDDFRKTLNQLMQTEGTQLLQYGNPLGYEPLRRYLGRQMRQHGISAKPDEMILTNGMQNGIEMVLRSLTNPGDCVFTESPTYASALSLMNYLGLTVIGIPMTNDGMDLEVLAEQLKKHEPKLLYTMPTFHNPTGLSSSQSHREQLLALCEKHQLPIMEDGFEEEMKYFGKAVLPVKSMDRHQSVIYLGTFSKVLFPGVRVGWIVASPKLIRVLERMKLVTDLSGSPFTQAAVCGFCEAGYYELHKRRIHRVYRKRMQLALQACREYLPANLVRFTKPDGGYLIWLTILNSPIREFELVGLFEKGGVSLSPGSRFFQSQQEHVYFRLSIAHRNEAEITEGIRRIGTIIQTINRHK